MPELSRYHASLLCKLTHDEVHEYGRLLAAQVQSITDEEIRQGHERKTMKDRMDRLEGERDRLAELVSTGSEKREIECIVQADYGTGKAYTIRVDTGEIIDERALKADEKQMGLGIAEADDVAAKMHLRRGDGGVVGEPQGEA